MATTTGKKHRIFIRVGEVLSVCPYSYNECQLPAREVCKLKQKLHTALDIMAWKQLTKGAEYCKYIGQHLTPSQYENKHLGQIT